jgi:trans-2,3-dihydro-3-hydroxyanthranilate isomerase
MHCGEQHAQGDDLMKLTYQIWDVFTDRALAGNPLAVVLDAQGLDEGLMQRVAQEFNLSETSFILPSECAQVRARYFTPSRELPMAGHPTIGTTYALHHTGRLPDGQTVLQLELGVGVIPVRLERAGGALERAWMNQGVPRLGEVVEDRAAAARLLGLQVGDLDPGLPVQVGSAGVPFLYVPVLNLEALRRARVTPQETFAALMPDDHKAVFVFTQHAPEVNVRSRMLGIDLGIVEDPATGSAHGPLGAYLATHGVLSFEDDEAMFVSHQGVEMGRPSRIEVRLARKDEGFEVHVGGSAVLVGEGRLYL